MNDNAIMIDTKDGHELAVYAKGNSSKPALIFLHGGPGGHINEKCFDFFNLDDWFVIAFDQRGTGQSKPFASLENNTPFHAVEDIELIRKYFNVESWTVFGGSYGSTLALLYAIKHPKRVEDLILRGIFLGRQADIDWLYQEGASFFYPIEHEKFKEPISRDEQSNLIDAYYKIFLSKDESKKIKAAKAWADWEGSLIHLIPDKESIKEEVSQNDISLALLECHFFANTMFWDEDNYILNRISMIQDIPTVIVHGRYDVDCRLSSAYELKSNMNHAELIIAEASGHSPYEENTFNSLQQTMVKLSENKQQ